MTKKEFVDNASSELKITKKQCDEAISALLQGIIEATDENERFAQPRFGIFKAAERNERIGINPQDKNFYKYPKKRRMKFTPSKSFKEEINV